MSVLVAYAIPDERTNQRGTNENTNGLLRRYLPKSADLKPLGQAELDAIAAELNGHLRQTPGWRTPAEHFLALTESGSA